jgi:ribonuclease D
MRRTSRESTAAPPTESAKRISREEMVELPIWRYEGSVHVVARHPDLQQAMRDILQESVVGFDTETRPAFRPGENYLPAIVQLATANAVYLFRIQQQELFGAMREILSSAKIIKAGVSVTNDMRSLKRLFDFDERSVVDLGKVAERHGLEQTGVRNLAGIFLGTRIPKGTKMTNWAAPLDAGADHLRGDRCLGVPRAVPPLQGTANGLTTELIAAKADIIATSGVPAAKAATNATALRFTPSLRGGISCIVPSYCAR